MRVLLLALFLSPFANCFGQKKQEFYNYYFKPTTGKGKYLVITEPQGNLWHRTAYYSDSGSEAMEVNFKDEAGKIKEGTEYWFYENKKLKSQTDYKEGKRNGVGLKFSDDGKLVDSANYIDGHVVGVKVDWDNDGHVTDSIQFDGKGNGYEKRFNKEGKLIAEGKLVDDEFADGEWKHYYPDGKISSVYQYSKGKIITSNCFQEDGKPRTDELCGEVEAAFPGGDKEWNSFVAKNFNVNVPIRNKAPYGLYEIVVRFVVGSDGSLEQIKALTNYGYGMEAEAEKAIRNSPKWKPAVQNGRFVKAYREQPITFSINKD